MRDSDKLNYLEFPARNIEATKRFFTEVFGWSFVDTGPDYTSFLIEGLGGGFFQSELSSTTKSGGALFVLYSPDLTKTMKAIVGAGGHIVRPVFRFPGGRRFHFTDPSGNEFAVWSDPGR